MARSVLSAASGQQTESGSVSGPGSYPSGGFSLETKLGRVDEAQVEIDNGSWDARKTGVSNNNEIVVQVFSEDTAVEAPDAQDLSGDSVTYSAHRL